ncbi:PH domain-containing protein [Streptosporangium soli]|nr:PH domain-containing protein [Streptosporangium sp. KLBMP 9127]
MTGEPEGWLRLHRRTLPASAVLSLALVVPLVTVLAKVLLDRDVTLPVVAAAGGGAALLVIVGVVVYDLFRWRATTYRITAERVELRSGIFVREHRSIPRDRVRTVDVTADPVRRVFGLAVVKIGTGESAGGDKAELTLDPVARRHADHLRATLLSLDSRDAGREPAAGAPIAELAWPWIRYAPLTVWSFIGGAVLLGAGKKALDVVGLDLFTLDAAGEAWERVQELPLWLAVLLLAAANLMVGVVGALAVFVESWWRYRLEREPGGTIRLRRGLLTTRSTTLTEARLRGVELVEPMLLRWGGGAKVKAIATGLNKDKNDKLENADSITPPLPRDVALRVAHEISPEAPGGPPGEPPLRPHPPAARTRRLRWAVLGAAALAAATGALDLAFSPIPWWAWTVPVVALPVFLALAADAYRGLAHGLTGRHLLTRSGTAARRTVALDRSGIIGWKIQQTVFQRRSGLATVTATTAAGGGAYTVLDAGEDDALDLACHAVPGLLSPFRTASPPDRDDFVTPAQAIVARDVLY